jgi:hypothetical protein
MNTSTGIYASFVMTVVAQEDRSRVVWPSCPASGWTGGVNTLTSIPNGKPLTTPIGGPRFETHGPYDWGSGFPAINGHQGENDPLNPLIPLSSLGGEPVGVDKPNVFASEFGCTVMSSFESMSPTLDQAHWGIHGGEPVGPNNPMMQRNHREPPPHFLVSMHR